MTWVAFGLAVVFGLVTGAMGVLGAHTEGRTRAFYSAACAVALIQALTLGVIATYPGLQSAAYVVLVSLVGIALVMLLVILARKSA